MPGKWATPNSSFFNHRKGNLMKFIHLSDLHLGKRVNEFSLLEDQAYILKEIIRIIDEERPYGVFICGDVYDKPVPSAEAVQLFDDFLVRLASRKLQVFVISGNHDSPERIAFGAKLMDASGIHMSPVYHGEVEPVVCRDNGEEVAVYMLPFIKPAHVRRFFPEEKIENYTDAIKTAIKNRKTDAGRFNILLTHQFVTGALRSESEEFSVGGSDNVDASVLEEFDYVALGHIHRPQQVSQPHIRYCGTPLKYSFSEANHEKSVTVVECGGKGQVTIRTIPLKPRRDMREIKGSYEELTLKANYRNTAVEDYLHITLTDEQDIPDVVNKLRVIYPNLMKLDYDNKRTRAANNLADIQKQENKSPLELFADFYELQNHQPMTEEQLEFCTNLIDEIWGN